MVFSVGTYPITSRLRRQRFLLLFSLSAAALILFIAAFCFDIHSSSRAGIIIAFAYMFTVFHSPRAGCMPFLYSSEIWGSDSRLAIRPGENSIGFCRELGRSWAAFCNFMGAGLVALFTPLGLKWGYGKFLGLFCGFSVIGFLLVSVPVGKIEI
jgi:hypothetical protein